MEMKLKTCRLNLGNSLVENTYKLVYLPFDFTEDEWEAIYDSTQCWDLTHE